MKASKANCLLGDLSNEEFMAMYKKATGDVAAWSNTDNRTAIIREGYTYKLYKQYHDGSWTCYQTISIY
jgi:hypothetical protein